MSILSYGRSLRRAMSPGERLRHLAGIASEKVHGCIGVSVVRSPAPGISNVEVALDGLDPVTAIQAMLVAIKRLTIIHNVAAPTIKMAVIDPATLQSIRQDAEDLTDYCRNGTLSSDGKLRQFDHTREDCVQTLMGSLSATLPGTFHVDEDSLMSALAKEPA